MHESNDMENKLMPEQFIQVLWAEVWRSIKFHSRTEHRIIMQKLEAPVDIRKVSTIL